MVRRWLGDGRAMLGQWSEDGRATVGRGSPSKIDPDVLVGSTEQPFSQRSPAHAYNPRVGG
eukprot:6816734-Lingulodinium_polyedra.AAC.1